MPATLQHLYRASHLQRTYNFVKQCTVVPATFRRHIRHATLDYMQNATTQDAKEQFYKHGLKSLSPGMGVTDILSRISNPREAPLGQSSFVKPKSLLYDLDGRTRKWDIIESHASVGIIIYHRGLDSFLIVRQWRPAVYAAACRAALSNREPQPPLSVGFTHELCAGIIDKEKGLLEICSEEILEECGYSVPPEPIKEVTSFLSATGTSGSRHVLFYSEVDEKQKVSSGGGLAESGECIELLALPVDNADAFVMDSSLGKSPGMMFGLLWAGVQFRTGQLNRAGASADGLQTGDLLLRSVLPT